MPRYTRRSQSCISVTVVHPASITAMAIGPARPCKSPRARMLIYALAACMGMRCAHPNWQVSTTGYRCPQPSLYAAAAAALDEAAAASPRGKPPSGSPNVVLPSCTAARRPHRDPFGRLPCRTVGRNRRQPDSCSPTAAVTALASASVSACCWQHVG